MRGSNALCKTCFVSFKKSEGHSKKHCSVECAALEKPRCKPLCTDFAETIVEFKNGSRHVKRFCKDCLRGGLIPVYLSTLPKEDLERLLTVNLEIRNSYRAWYPKEESASH